jgi:hypothetical protein
MMRRSVLWVGMGLCLVFGAIGVFLSGTSTAGDIHPSFQRTWERTDRPVATGDTSRTWMWGPHGHTDAFYEPYLDAPDGQRLVQYFDKTRMEFTDPDADPNGLWAVTQGLLALELITGKMQTGDASFEQHASARVQIAGDAHPESPTYATFHEVMNANPRDTSTIIDQTINRHGMVGTKNALVSYQVTADHFVEQTNHTIASVFWEFMNSTGEVFVEGELREDALFENPFFGVGLPITEAYWIYVPVNGEWNDVLVQCFERRCLTYTPSNPDGWQVEAGNIGQHYHTWRYETEFDELDPTDSDRAGVFMPSEADLGPPVSGACEANSQAKFMRITDSLGNVNPNSWAQGTGGDWSPGIDASPEVDAGQQLTFMIEADGDCAPLEYRVQRYRPEREIDIIQPWTEEATFSYTFEPNDIDDYLMLIVDVRNQDPRHHFEDRDDYTYLTYYVR